MLNLKIEARMRVELANLYIHTYIYIGAEMLNLKIEARMRVELANLGLMERPDIEYDQVSSWCMRP
jgi:hypothetical protein